MISNEKMKKNGIRFQHDNDEEEVVKFQVQDCAHLSTKKNDLCALWKSLDVQNQINAK